METKTGFEAVEHIRSGGDLYFPSAETDVIGVTYDKETMKFYYILKDGTAYLNGWNEAHIANRKWEI